MLAAHLLHPAEREAGANAGEEDPGGAARIVRQPEYGERREPHRRARVTGREAMAGLPDVRHDVEQAQEGMVAAKAIDAPRTMHV